jgi:hypothetical protein
MAHLAIMDNECVRGGSARIRGRQGASEAQGNALPTRKSRQPEAQGTIVAASVGQIYVFINYSVQEQFIQGTEVPKYEGEYARYPVYNGWIVMTKNRRLPWIPQTLGDRIDREEQKRQRALDDWNKLKAGRKMLDEAAQMKTYEMLKETDPAGAEKFLATVRQTADVMRKQKAEEPITDAHLQGHLKAVRGYRASFSQADLNAPAVWADKTGEAKRRLDAQIVEFQKLTPDDQLQADTLGRQSRDLERQARTEKDSAAAAKLRDRSTALALRVREIRQAHTDRAFFQIQAARAAFDLANLKPGPPDQAMTFKPDPTFPDFRDPFRPQLIMVNFWSKSDPKDNSPRTLWLRKAKETFDFAALEALLR